MSRRPRTKSYLIALILGLASVGKVMADAWEPLTGTKTLQDFVAGARAVITVQPGVTVVGTYNADGTATIDAWGETFERTWKVVGEDQVRSCGPGASWVRW